MNPSRKYKWTDLENTCQPFHLAVHNSKYLHSFFVKALQSLRISNSHLSLIVLNWHLYPFRQVSKVTSCRHMLLNQDHQYHGSALIFSFIREICLYWQKSYLLGIIKPKKWPKTSFSFKEITRLILFCFELLAFAICEE